MDCPTESEFILLGLPLKYFKSSFYGLATFKAIDWIFYTSIASEGTSEEDDSSLDCRQKIWLSVIPSRLFVHTAAVLTSTRYRSRSSRRRRMLEMKTAIYNLLRGSHPSGSFREQVQRSRRRAAAEAEAAAPTRGVGVPKRIMEIETRQGRARTWKRSTWPQLGKQQIDDESPTIREEDGGVVAGIEFTQ